VAEEFVDRPLDLLALRGVVHCGVARAAFPRRLSAADDAGGRYAVLR
jgi:hypothetical protein